MTDPIILAYIGLASTSLVIAGQLALMIVANRHTVRIAEMKEAVRETKEAFKETKDSIITLEKNTNSIKDALVKVTGESEFAKGLKLGISMPTDALASTNILADAESKAAESAIHLAGVVSLHQIKEEKKNG